MRLRFLASRCPEYRALRAQSQGWAHIWQLGHGIFWICILSLPGVIAAWWVSRDETEPHRNVVWSLIAPVLLVAMIGVALKRYAIKKGRASGAVPG
jgi:hypothetical protein